MRSAFQSSSRLGRSIWLPSSRDCRSSFARFRERLQANSSKRLNLLRACTAHRVYRKVTLPLVRGQILSGLLLGISRASGEVGITMMVGGNISDRTNTLSLEIWNAVSRADFDVATTLCLLLSAFTLLIFIVLDRLQRRAGAL